MTTTSADPLALKRMGQRIVQMSNDHLKIVWDCLQHEPWGPEDYWDHEGKILMDTWAEQLQAEMEQRGLKER